MLPVDLYLSKQNGASLVYTKVIMEDETNVFLKSTNIVGVVLLSWLINLIVGSITEYLQYKVKSK